MSENRVRERMINEHIFAHVMVTQLALAKVIVHLGLADTVSNSLKGANTFVYGESVSSSGKTETTFGEAPIMQRAVKEATDNFLGLIEAEQSKPK